MLEVCSAQGRRIREVNIFVLHLGVATHPDRITLRISPGVPLVPVKWKCAETNVITNVCDIYITRVRYPFEKD